MSCYFSPTKPAPTHTFPLKSAALPPNDYINLPTVIMDGNAWGFIIISGTIPS
jgi:hypothetical protein